MYWYYWYLFFYAFICHKLLEDLLKWYACIWVRVRSENGAIDCCRKAATLGQAAVPKEWEGVVEKGQRGRTKKRREQREKKWWERKRKQRTRARKTFQSMTIPSSPHIPPEPENDPQPGIWIILDDFALTVRVCVRLCVRACEWENIYNL